MKNNWTVSSLFYNPYRPNLNVNVPYRHKHEILSEKVIIFHEFILVIKKSASNLVCKYLYSF